MSVQSRWWRKETESLTGLLLGAGNSVTQLRGSEIVVVVGRDEGVMPWRLGERPCC